MNANKPVIVGIDPGTARIGFGVIRGTHTPELLEAGLLNITPPARPKEGGDRVPSFHEIRAELSKLLLRYRPALVAIEKLYVAKNSKAALAVAEARGIVRLVAQEHAIEVVEYAPASVKKIVTGDGRADKRGIAFLVTKILRLKEIPAPDDVTDALAIALAATSEFHMRALRAKLSH